MIFLPSKRNIHCHHEQKKYFIEVLNSVKKMTDLVENGITVKVEYTDDIEDASPPPPRVLPPPPPPPKASECLWCSKKLLVKCTIAGFCSETCFTASRRARFKKEKFGIDTVPKRSSPSKPEPTSSKVALALYNLYLLTWYSHLHQREKTTKEKWIIRDNFIVSDNFMND